MAAQTRPRRAAYYLVRPAALWIISITSTHDAGTGPHSAITQAAKPS